MTSTDDVILDMVENEVLGTTYLGAAGAQREVSNLLDLAASGVSAETIAPKVRERQAALERIEQQLRLPRPERPNIEKLRDALNQRAAAWRETLRAEPKVARLLLRRLVGPQAPHLERFAVRQIDVWRTAREALPRT